MRRCYKAVGHSLKTLPIFTILASAAILFGSYVEVADAYIDPTAGGTLLQFFMGGFLAGVLLLGRLFWSSIISLVPFGRRRNHSDNDRTEQSGESPGA
jgi:hypothetical protein